MIQVPTPLQQALASRAVLVFLALLLLTDVTFIGIHLGTLGGLLPAHARFRLNFDHGYAEAFQYVKELWIAVMLLVMAVARRSWLWLCWSVFFAYLLADDMLRVHETLGARVAGELTFESVLGVERHDLGELAVNVLAASVLLGGIAILHLRAGPATRAVSGSLFLLVGVLVIFGVGFDQFQAFVPFGNRPRRVIEDGGEMLAMSAIAAFVFAASLGVFSTAGAKAAPADE